MSNYIKHLEGIRRDALYLSHQSLDELHNFYAYLLSSKFDQDPTIQVRDVMNRLEAIRSNLGEVIFLTSPQNTVRRLHHLEA
jgi:hypothetical protein